MMLKIKTRTKSNAIIIEIEGEVDLYSSPQVRKTIIDLTQQKKPALLINLEAVPYMDSSGVATLVEGLQRMKEYGGKLCIYNLQGTVRDVFELSRLDKVFNIFDNETEAIKACHDQN
jgi:anti-sigma B factor antagonist